MTEPLILELPWPPSVNRYWRHLKNGRTLKSREGREYETAVCGVVFGQKFERFHGEVKVEIDLYPPDRRRRDIDNTQKGLLDSLGTAGVYQDDSQIVELNVCKREIKKGGLAVVRISASVR